MKRYVVAFVLTAAAVAAVGTSVDAAEIPKPEAFDVIECSEANGMFPFAIPEDGAKGAAKGWDGVFQYSYNHYPEGFGANEMPWCVFDAVANPAVLVHFPACPSTACRATSASAPGSKCFLEMAGAYRRAVAGRL